MATETFVQDPNTPKFNATTGQPTDYGKSLGLTAPITSQNLNNSGTPLTLATPTTPTFGGVEPLVNANLAQAKITNQESIDSAKNYSDNALKALMSSISEGGQISANQDRTEQDKAKKKYDQFTSQLEQEALSNRRRIETLQKKNKEGLFGGGLQQEVNRINTESLSKQADIAILQSAANRDYSTASEIADRQVALKMEANQAKTEALKLFYQDNKDRFTKLDDRLYSEKIKEMERVNKKQEDTENTIKEIKLLAVKNGAGADVLSALSKVDTTKPGAFDEALKAAGSSLATSENDIVKLDNGNTILVDKRTGRVVKSFGGGKGTTPSVVVRKVGDTPVTGYTLREGDDNNVLAQLYGTTVSEIKRLNPNVKDWNNLQIGQVLNVPQKTEDTFIQSLKATEGGKNLTDTSIQKLDKGLTVLNQLGVLQTNVEGVKTGPIVGAFKSANPWDTQGQTIKASLNAIVPNLARGVYGEVGVLTDNDIKTYSQTIPNLSSTEEVRNAVLYITLDMIGKSIKNTLSVNAAAGRDVSGFTDIYTEMENTKNSILSGIPSAQVPQAFQSQGSDDFLNQFSPQNINSSLSNSDFFNQI